MSPDPVLVERLNQHGQSHLLRWWGELNEDEQARLASEVGSIDFGQLDRLIAELVRDDVTAVPAVDRVQPIEVIRLPQTDGERVVRRRAGGMGADALAAGEVGVILVAGGSGTRLGYEGPKGTFPIGPVSSASLFQIHAEKIVALARPPWATIPLYIMTSPENHEVTVDFFEKHDRFGLDHVRFFTQGQMPAVDRATGKVLLASRDRVALSPDGHGGTLAALAAPGARRRAQLPRRDARAGRADALLLSGRQSAGSDRRAVVHRPASRGERRGVVQGRRAAFARRKAGGGRGASTAARR